MNHKLDYMYCVPGIACSRYHMGEREGKMTVLGIFLTRRDVGISPFFQVLVELLQKMECFLQ